MQRYRAQAPDPMRDRCVCGVTVGGRTGAVHICGRWLHRECWDRLDNTLGAVERVAELEAARSAAVGTLHAAGLPKAAELVRKGFVALFGGQ